MSEYKTDPRSYALGLVEEGSVSADHLLLCALKYMSHDDVRDMLHCNELAPECGRCDEIVDDDEELCESCQLEQDKKEYLEEHSEGYDTDGMMIDLDNGNLEVGDDADEYLHESIVARSIEDGQLKQAREQCEEFNLDFDEMMEGHG